MPDSPPQSQPSLPPSDTGDSLLARVKRATPGPIRAALKPVVESIRSATTDGGLPGGASRDRLKDARKDAPPARKPGGAGRRYRQADAWIDNRFTFNADGRTHKCFFITGCYKSGTNWVQNILNLHPRVNCKGEFHFEALWKGYEAFTGQPWFLATRPRMREIATDSMQDVVRRMMYAYTRDKPEALWLGDRTPRRLTELLPGAPLIHILRDGRDVMVSWNFHHLRVRSPDRVWEGVRPLAERLLPEFRADPQAFEQRGKGFLYDETWFRAHARVWAEGVLHDLKAVPQLRDRGTPLLEIEYGALHADTSVWRTRLFELLGLDEREAAPLSVETKTLAGFKDPSPTKFYRKGVVGEWRDYFDETLTRWFKEEAGEALIAAGYARDGKW